MEPRRVARIVSAQPTSEGAGVKLRRSIGTPELDHVDPFLLLDEFRSDDAADYMAGFPDHPHRGFETVTYMLAGSMAHEDHRGNKGTLVAGSVQWMTAGRGIIHSEMPRQENGLMWGFQLWVNLPARDKMTEPHYQEIAPDAVPRVEREDGTVLRIVAGTAEGRQGAVRGIATDPLYLDVAMPSGTRLEQAVPAGHNAVVYVFEGTALVGGGPDQGPAVSSGQLAVLGDGDSVAIATEGSPARFLLIAAHPLREPIARYGPFVMNTREEIVQAVRDLQSGSFLG
jgi:hypothetical protein